MKKKKGAPRGNRNARNHGFYSQVLSDVQQLNLKKAGEIEGIDEEIAITKVLTEMPFHSASSH